MDFLSVLVVVGVGACFGFGIQWGFWLWDGCGELLQDLRGLLRRKP